jgi:hypothetical protein
MKSTAVLRKYKPTPYEKAAMYALDADLRKQHQRISDNPGERAELVRKVFRTHPDKYQLCREVVRVTRVSHNSGSDRFPTTINKTLRMLARDGKKPAASVTTA